MNSSLISTNIKINKRIYRFGLEARPLLYVLSSILILGTIFVGMLGYIGAGLCILMVYGFIRLKNYLTTEIEKGNLSPLETLLGTINKTDSLNDDYVRYVLKDRAWKP